MRRAWFVGIALVVLGVSASIAAEPAAASAVALQCVPPSTLIVPGGVRLQGGPPVAVVDTAVRPGRTRLFLDGRYIGLAKDFDGGPDYLYLRSGHYLLELRLEGYASASYSIDAKGGCLFELRHRMDRIPRTPKDPWWGRKPRPQPFLREYAPLRTKVAPAPAPARVPGPDLALRPELELPSAGADLAAARFPTAGSASLRIQVAPASAAVYLDGEFLVTGAELGRLHEPIAVSAGPHSIEVVAPGYKPREQSFEVLEGAELELVLELEPEAD